MPQPTFSIVIPTCDRDLTLGFAIRSVLNNDFGDFEIVVSDNDSTPETYDVVRGLADFRIRYFRTPRRLSMRDNWEFALSQAVGRYIHFLGDDDALLPDSMGLARMLFERYGFSVLTWGRVNIYWWPDCTSPGRRNFLSIQFPGRVPTFQMAVPRPVIDNVFKCRSMNDYEVLPMVYNSFVSHSVIDRVRSNFGYYFGSHSPDSWSGLANAWYLESYCFSTRPLSIAGVSGKSNGWAFSVSSRSDIARKFAQEGGYDTGCIVHSRLPQYNCHELTSAGLFLDFRDALGEKGEDLKIDYLNLIKSMLEGMASRSSEYDDYLAAIGELCREHRIDLAAHGLSIPARPSTSVSINDDCLTAGPRHSGDGAVLGLNLFCPAAGVYDVAAAAKLMLGLLPPTPTV